MAGTNLIVEKNWLQSKSQIPEVNSAVWYIKKREHEMEWQQIFSSETHFDKDTIQMQPEESSVMAQFKDNVHLSCICCWLKKSSNIHL